MFKKKKSTGLIPQEKDERDYKYKIYSNNTLLTNIDLRNKFPEVSYQNGYSSCTYHAVSALIDYELKYFKKFNNWNMKTSEAYGWYYGRLLLNTQNSNSGTVLRDAFKVIKKYGFVPEVYWTYKNGIYKEPDYKTKLIGNTFKLYIEQLKGYYSINRGDIQSILNALDNEHPVVFGMFTNNEYQNLKYPGFVNIIEETNGAHAQLIVGYFYKDDILYFIVRNSWGKSWGDNGYCYISEFIIRNSFDFWCLQ